MNTIYLLRHSLTIANERRLYCGRTDLALSPKGIEQARAIHQNRPLPVCDLYLTSGMRRAEETLLLLTGRKSDCVLPELCEINFGRFEMLGYDDLKSDADYLRWIEDDKGTVSCPGGECSRDFVARVRRGGDRLLQMAWDSAVAVCHGGTIVRLMEYWFPGKKLAYYDWQPAACGGWRIEFKNLTSVAFYKL